MKIKYDNKIDAKYIYLREGKIVRTHKEKEWLLFDYDKDNNILGVEILNASSKQGLAFEKRLKNGILAEATSRTRAIA